jgi:hypothetical protein
VPIAAGGRELKLGDFTTITRGYEDPPQYTVRHNGQQVLMLGIVMTDDGNIVELGKRSSPRSPRFSRSCRTVSSSSAWPTSLRWSANPSGNSNARCSKRSRSCSRSAC